MNRKDFLKSLGMTGAAIFATYCLGSCGGKSGSDTPAPATTLPDTGITLDLNSSQYSSLKTNGNFVVLAAEKIVVARTTQGNLVAVTRICSHQGQEQITYKSSGNLFECGAHQAQFDTSGVGLNSNGSNGLKVYRTQLNQAGDQLTIFNS